MENITKEKWYNITNEHIVKAIEEFENSPNKYAWLKTPDPDNPPQEYKDIIRALVEYRDQGGFLKSGLHPSCDFVFEDHKLMFEYDEYQHFSQARKIALENYPETIHVYFSKNDWIEQCSKIKAKDNSPIDRDERRAYFDSVRDIEADKHGYTLIRIKHGDFDLEDTHASAYLDTLLSKT